MGRVELAVMWNKDKKYFFIRKCLALVLSNLMIVSCALERVEFSLSVSEINSFQFSFANLLLTASFLFYNAAI